MNVRLKYACIGLVLLTFGIVLYCLIATNEPNQSLTQRIEIPVVAPTLGARQEPTEIAATPTPNIKIAIVPTPSPMQRDERNEAIVDRSITHAVSINITDAMSEPIPSGVIQFGTESKSFSSGNIRIPHFPSYIGRALVRSDGYEAADVRIDPASDCVRVCLEYLTDYRVQVFWDEEYKTPAPGIRVELRKGGGAIRPIPDRLDFTYVSRGDALLQGSLVYDGDGIIVSGVSLGAKSFEPIYESGLGDLSTNDRIVGVSGFLWGEGVESLKNPVPLIQKQANRNSARLRIFDALTAYRAGFKQSIEKKDFVDVQRREERLFVCLGKVSESAPGEVIQTQVTGADGSCVFQDVLPGSYFAQALNGDVRSSVAYLHPAKGKEKVYLSRLFSDVTVRVVRAGVSRILAGVENASVWLQSEQQDVSSVPLAGKTNQYGKIVFPSTPFGTYRLIVETNGGEGERPYQERIEITEPKHAFYAYLERSGYTISGVVREIQTKDLIEGFTLNLYRLSGGIMGSHSITQSDAQGQYTFRNVPSGKYLLLPIINEDNDCGVIPAYRAKTLIPSSTRSETLQRMQVGNRSQAVKKLQQSVKSGLAGGYIGDGDNRIFQSIPLDEMELEILDSDVTNLIYPVVYRTPSIVSGAVFCDGESVENAVVEMECQDVRFLENPVLTDASGRYSLSLYALSERKTYKSRISAIVYDDWEEGDRSLLNPFVRNKLQYSSKGVENVTFQSGDRIDNVDIVIRKSSNDYIVRGRIVCEDYSKLDGLTIEASQNEEPLKIQLNDRGEYEISNLEPGRVSLAIRPRVYAIDEPQLGKRPFTDYCNYYETFAISSIRKVVEKDIELTPATYLMGRLLLEDRTPVTDVQISAELKSKRMRRAVKTDENGYFWLWGIEPSREYSLSAITLDGKILNIFPSWGRGGGEMQTVVATLETP